MDGRVDETEHDISLCRFENTPANKKYKEQKLSEIITAICAMLNSNGGNVVLHNECNCEKCKSFQMSLVVRILEQSMVPILGVNQTVSNLNFEVDAEKTLILVKKSDCLITTNYNLHLPGKSQVLQVSPCEPLENVKRDIINREVIEEPVQLGSHCKRFVKDSTFSKQESKTVQLKYVKADPSKRTRLVDRMTGKGNKFSCYVSAFANYNGGHIFYGIRDDGVVEGELISNVEDISEITNKVQKAINKTIWPEHIGQPKRGVRWEIFFEPVVAKNAKPIPSTFVIVIYIAACIGGVFTEKPECYEMVEGKVEKMSFATWKERIQFTKLDLPHVAPVSVRSICILIDQLLTQCIDNGDSCYRISRSLEKLFPETIEVRLLVLSKKIMCRYRSGFFKEAEELLDEYTDLLPKTREYENFDALRAYLVTAICRAKEDLETLRYSLVDALQKAEKIAPGLISAAIYLLAASVMDLLQSEDDQTSKLNLSLEALLNKALQHLQYVHDSPIVRADMEQKAHMTLALFHLGCDVHGNLTREHINDESLEKANSSVMEVSKLIDEEKELNNYRDIQFYLVKSVLFYRKSQEQVQFEEKKFLQEAFNFARKAEGIANRHKFVEMLSWARTCKSFCTENLVRRHFQNYDLKSHAEANPSKHCIK